MYTIGLNNGGFLRGVTSARGALNGLASSIGNVVKVAGGLAAVGGLTASFFGLKKAITAAADMESTKVAFAGLLGSAEAAAEVLRDIEDLAAATPYGLTDLNQAARSLFAVTEKEDLTDTLRMIGDLASSAQKPIADLAFMYSKIKGGDQVYGEDLNQIADALGGKALQEFVKVLNVDSVGAVRKLASEGKITGAVLEQVFRNLTAEGGMAFNAMAAQSRTFNGLVSTLQDSFDALFRTIGQPINDFLKPMLDGAITKLTLLGNGLKAFVQLATAAQQQGQLGDFLGDSLVLGAMKAINALSAGFRGSIAFLGAALPAVFTSAINSTFGTRFAIVIESVFRAAGDIISAATRDAAADFLEALGKSGKAGQWREFADADRERAALRMQTAKGAIAGTRGADLGEIATGVLDAYRVGAEAMDKAMGDAEPIFNTDAVENRLKKMGTGLDPVAMKNLEDALAGKVPAAVETLAKKTDEAGKKLVAAAEQVNKQAKGAVLGDPAASEGSSRRRGILNAADSFLQRLGRRAPADLKKDPLERSSMDRSALDTVFRRQDKAGRLQGDRVPGADWLYFRLQQGMGNRIPQAAGAAQGAAAEARRAKGDEVMSRQEKLLASIDQHLARLSVAT
jgi:hypothetical protein